MSGTTAALLGAGTSLVQAIMRPSRRIGSIIPGIVVEERHSDQIRITSHPVQQGSNVSDHAYAEPPTVTIRASWSDADLGAVKSLLTGGNLLGTLTDGAFGSQSYSAQKYQQVLALMYSYVPFTVVTGKRMYKSMLIQSVSEVTNRGNEYCLVLDIMCKYINIVTTSSATLPPTTSQANPQQTDSKQNSGTQTAAPTGISTLRNLGNDAGLTTPGSTTTATPGAAIGFLGTKLKEALP